MMRGGREAVKGGPWSIHSHIFSVSPSSFRVSTVADIVINIIIRGAEEGEQSEVHAGELRWQRQLPATPSARAGW